MPTRILFVIASDPRVSPRAAEGVRIAAGVSVWRKVEVTLCLCETAALALAENADELVDGESFARHLPLLTEGGRTIYVETGAPLLISPETALAKHERIGVARLAELAAQSQCVIRF